MNTELVPIADLETESTDLVIRASALEITTHAGYEFAASVGKELSDMKKAVKSYWNDEATGPTTLAHRAWKATVAKRDEMLDPLDRAGKAVAKQIIAWEAEQARIAHEKQREIDEAARKEREAEVRRAAAAAKKAGANKEDVKVLRQQMRDEPIMTPTVAPPPPPKGMSTPRPWMAKLAGQSEQEQARSLHQLVCAIAKDEAPLSLIKIDQPILNRWAKATKGTTTIPGVTIYRAVQVRF